MGISTDSHDELIYDNRKVLWLKIPPGAPLDLTGHYPVVVAISAKRGPLYLAEPSIILLVFLVASPSPSQKAPQHSHISTHVKEVE